jgi:inhibitor of cysteine peptidase
MLMDSDPNPNPSLKRIRRLSRAVPRTIAVHPSWQAWSWQTRVLLGAFGVAAMAIMLAGCGSRSTPGVEVDCDEFRSSPSAVRSLQVEDGATFTVTLCSNPSTGFGWEAPVISGGVTLEQRETFAPTEGPPLGAAGRERFTFKASEAEGPHTVAFSYSQPWDGGMKNTWRMELRVTVD